MHLSQNFVLVTYVLKTSKHNSNLTEGCEMPRCKYLRGKKLRNTEEICMELYRMPGCIELQEKFWTDKSLRKGYLGEL